MSSASTFNMDSPIGNDPVCLSQEAYTTSGSIKIVPSSGILLPVLSNSEVHLGLSTLEDCKAPVLDYTGEQKTTVSIGTQVNLCCCGSNQSSGKLNGNVQEMISAPALTVDSGSADAEVKPEAKKALGMQDAERSESVSDDILFMATQNLLLQKQLKDSHRKGKKRRKAEKAAVKQPHKKKQKILIRRSTKSTLERRFLCEGCGIRFVHKATYDRHLLELRGNASENKCFYCGSTFNFLCKLKQHIAAKHFEVTATPGKERPVICTICGIKLQTSISMNKHMRIHNGEKPFQCKYCSKAFRWHTGLEYHERIHTGERPFKCPNCPKAFTNPSDLTRHQTVHTGKKPHLCHECGKGFTQSGTLRAHIKSKHITAQPSIECDSSIGFVTIAATDRSPIHPNPSPPKGYLCHICGQNFSHNAFLRVHVKKFHHPPQQQQLQQQHQQQLEPMEGDIHCSTLEDMKLQLASCNLAGQNQVFNYCIPTEKEIAEVVVKMLDP